MDYVHRELERRHTFGESLGELLRRLRDRRGGGWRGRGYGDGYPAAFGLKAYFRSVENRRLQAYRNLAVAFRDRRRDAYRVGDCRRDIHEFFRPGGRRRRIDRHARQNNPDVVLRLLNGWRRIDGVKLARRRRLLRNGFGLACIFRFHRLGFYNDSCRRRRRRSHILGNCRLWRVLMFCDYSFWRFNILGNCRLWRMAIFHRRRLWRILFLDDHDLWRIIGLDDLYRSRLRLLGFYYDSCRRSRLCMF